MKKRIGLCCKESGDRKFYYIDFGPIHNFSFRLWINRRLVQEDDEEAVIEFPVRNSCIKKTLKGNYVLREAKGFTTFDIYIPCEFRDTSKIEILKPQPEMVLNYYLISSMTNILDCFFPYPKSFSSGMVITVVGDEVLYRWSKCSRDKTGIKVNETGIIKVTADGKEITK